MSVRQLKQNKITKDGRSWVFIQYSKGLDGKRHQYQSKAFMTEEEAIRAEKAGIKRIRLHDFRHSCASALISGAAPITAVSNFLSHSETIEALETYTHIFKKNLANVPKFFDTLEKEFNEKSSE